MNTTAKTPAAVRFVINTRGTDGKVCASIAFHDKAKADGHFASLCKWLAGSGRTAELIESK
jgi:hypothetical protein